MQGWSLDAEVLCGRGRCARVLYVGVLRNSVRG
jgi:hypothetical protein